LTYPVHWEADVVAADGGTLHLRPITPADADEIVAFHGGLSTRTRYLRYFSAYPTIPERDLHRFTHVDHHDRVAIVAVLGERIIAVGRYERTPGTSEAEVAFVVADAHQGRGIGSVLLEHLAAAAQENGLTRFVAVVLMENQAMMRVFRDAGYAVSRSFEVGEVYLEFDLRATPLTESVMREREQHADSRSIRRFLYPASVAVIGASNEEGKIGHAVFRNLLAAGFAGTLYPVNPEASLVQGVPCYPTVADVPGSVELAVIAVPAAAVLPIVEQCGHRQVHGLIVASGGFGERGGSAEREAGRQAQRRLVAVARSHGMRVVGPNCLGVANTDPAVQLNATLAPRAPTHGRAGFFCQSGALGVAVLGEAARRGLGVSTFVSAGNRSDVSGNDLLQYWETDDATDVALLYLESFGNPRKFARVARRMARTKPIVAVKSGRASTVAGLQHTSVDVPDVSVQALFEASGVIRVDTLGDLFDVALLLAAQPLPAGDRVAVVGNSTALAVLVSDACTTDGLQLTQVVDVGVDTSPAEFGAAVRAATAADDVESVIAVFVPPLLLVSGEEHAAALRAVAAASNTVVLSTFLGFEGVPAALAAPGPAAPAPGSVPSYPTPERAVRALARAVRYARWRSRPPGVVPTLDVDPSVGRAVVAAALADAPEGRPLRADETARLLAAYGVAVVAARPVRDTVAAVAALDELGAPVALRAGDAVRLHLRDADDVRAAWRSLGPPPGTEVTVQRMAVRGVDVVLDVQDDRSFGALVSFGIGGVATELLGDRAYAVVPLTESDASALIEEPKAAPLLAGYGGRPAVDRAALAELALRISALADDLPEVVELRIAGVAAPTGVAVLSAAGRLVPSVPRADTGPRRLRGL
jgi:acyl-CoA synthetase (NDP forming)/RimJ/RimL family protein N-acetyltransferase